MKGIPLYLQISNKILDNIKNGVYHENSLLPSERELCQLFHVSRATIRQALISLEGMGNIYKIHGKGTFVKPKSYVQDLSGFYSFSQEIKKYNAKINNDIIDCETININEKLSMKLNRQINDSFYKITRLRSANNVPLMIEITYLPKSRFYIIDMGKLQEISLYDYLFKYYNVSIEKAVETLKPCLPKPNECNLLDISAKTPCTLLERFSYEGTEIVEYTVSVIRGDKYTFKVELNNLKQKDKKGPE